MKRVVLAALAAAVLAAPAQGLAAAKQVEEAGGASLVRQTTGATYFNRPGADIAAHDAELIDCIDKAATIVTVSEAVNGPGLAAMMARGGPISAGVENCMVVRGWRVVRLPEAEGAALAKLPAEALSARLAPWVGQAQPNGEIARVWSNEAARASVKRYEVRAFTSGKGSLSTLSLGERKVRGAAPPAKPPKVTLDKSWPVKAIKPEAIASAPPQTAVIVFGVKGISMRDGVAVSFSRVGPGNDFQPAITDHAPDFLTVPGRWGKTEGFYTVIALPPGKWRIASMGIMPTLGLCLGAPYFEAKAGEVVYAGMFDMGSETLGPDLSLGPVKTFLAGQQAAEQIRPASYTNGLAGPCGGAGIYALEIPGAPFEPGYAWGGAYAGAAADTAAPAAP